MLETRGAKYKWFLRALKTFKYASMSPTRGSFLESYYTLMRYVDDIVDGDAPLPEQYKTSEQFVLEKIDFSQNPTSPQDSADYLMLHCFELADKFGQDFSSETQDILESMLFDSRRYGTGNIFPDKELHHHFHMLDVRGTIGATLKVFGEDPEKYPILEPLGLACRIHYNIRDYEEDIAAGLVNIPKEDCEYFGIKDLNMNSPEIQSWFRYQAIQGMKLLRQHEETVDKGDFGLLARLTFNPVYLNPAKKCFERVMYEK